MDSPQRIPLPLHDPAVRRVLELITPVAGMNEDQALTARSDVMFALRKSGTTAVVEIVDDDRPDESEEEDPILGYYAQIYLQDGTPVYKCSVNITGTNACRDLIGK